MDAEWNKLRYAKRPDPKDKGVGVWDETMVMEASDVRNGARQAGDTVHFLRIAELCMQKGSELAEDDPQRKFKGRAVCLGHEVRDEYFNYAEFQELSSNPPSMQAARALDCLGCTPDYTVKTGDARGAYTQSYLKGHVKTWVSLPSNRWPASWKGMKNPVCPLVLALYGHPDAGGYWEQHCDERICSLGFEKIAWEWPGVYWHPVKQALLVIYVDDFKLAAKHKDQDELWKGIKSVIDMDDELSLIHISEPTRPY